MAMSSVTVAAPAVKGEEPECSKSRHHVHLRKRGIVTETKVVTRYVDAAGNPLPISSSQLTVAPSNLQISSSSTALNIAPVQPPLQPALETASTSPPTYSSVSSSPESVPSSPIDNPPTPPWIYSATWEDGVYPCSEFPYQPNIVRMDYLQRQGYTGIFDPADNSARDECTEGRYCSYACKNGFAKSQWPENQPADGKSVGGLFCKHGFLHRSNMAYTDLCIPQPDKVIAKSEIDQVVSFCQTDYPGLEEMIIATEVKPGSTTRLTCIALEGYYTWMGKPTTAQFYVNNAGVTQEEGCRWGYEGSDIGNWAPLVFGSGVSGELAYISLFKNPNNPHGANFNAELIADGPDSKVNGQCQYVRGKFLGANPDGCTVAVERGRAVVRIW